MRFALLSLGVLFLPAARAAADWQPVATDLLAKHKTGFGGLSGVAVERDTGALYVSRATRAFFAPRIRANVAALRQEGFKGAPKRPGASRSTPPAEPRSS